MQIKAEEIRKQVKDLCLKIDKRMGELGEVDIMTYRNDPIMKDLRNKICELYRQGVNYCKTYNEALSICKIFQEEPTCLNQLMLSEELTCPLPQEKK